MKLDKILEDLLCEGARPEASIILNKCSKARLVEFLHYYEEDKCNICCMVLDVAKKELVESGDMVHSEDDYFGSPWLEVNSKF
jgi:hypothetical protein